MIVGITGVGAVGLEWARAIAGAGLAELVLVDPHPEAEPRSSWAREQGVGITTSAAALGECDLILLCVPGGAQPEVVDRLVPVVAEGSTVVDLSTAAVLDKQRAAELLPSGYVDVAIAGAVALTGVHTPLLVAGEPGEGVRELFAAVGAPARYLEEAGPGDAVRIKLLRSVITKGLEALAVEVLPVARAHGLLDALLDALGDVDERPFADLLRAMVATHPSQAYRRQLEAREAAGQVTSSGYPSIVSSATEQGFAATVAQAQRDPVPSRADLDEVLDWLGHRRTHT